MHEELDTFLLTMLSDTSPVIYSAEDVVLAYLSMDDASLGSLCRVTGLPREIVRYAADRLTSNGAIVREGSLRKKYSITFFGRLIALELPMDDGL